MGLPFLMDRLFILLISFGVTSLSLLLRALFLGDLEPGAEPVDFLLFGVLFQNRLSDAFARLQNDIVD